MKRLRHIGFLMALLLLAGGAMNVLWAAKVTYHILTLPIDNDIYHMKDAVSGHRLEAVKIVVDNQSTVQLPDHYKSPLATDFTYYEPTDIAGHGGSAISLYDDVATSMGVLYDVKASPTPVAEGTAITTSTAEYYVVYTYNASNTIAKLDGSVNYNIGVKNKGFLALNRGRNNRPAVVPTGKVNPEMLASEDFSYVNEPGEGIGTYWADGNNKNNRQDVESQFFFGFKFEGEDPYHIIVRTSYAKDITYIEKNEKTSNFVYKWYKEGALMASGAGSNINAYFASDDHIIYTTPYDNSISNPTNPAYDARTGYFHGNNNIWSTVALLNNTNNTGYVFMGTRTVDGSGNIPTPSGEKYNYLTFNGYNNLNYLNITGKTATDNHTVNGIYPLKKVTFKIATPFYAVEQTDAHIISAATEWVSQYTVDNDPIESAYLPSSLQRKYCTFSDRFYSDAACTHEVTYFSEATESPTEGYQVYIGYEVSASIPFKGITPAATYDASTWANATWYELTDKDETADKKITWNSDPTNNFQNNGVSATYEKESEFAFIGDPYELQVIHRSQTSSSTPYYLGNTFGVSRTTDISYGTNYEYYEPAGAQTMTFHVSGFTAETGNKYKVEIGGTDAGQVTAYTPASATDLSSTSADVTVTVSASGGTSKLFTVTITETESDGSTPVGTPTVITVHQLKAGYSWDIPDDETEGSLLLRKYKDEGHWYWDASASNQTITYSTDNSTRVKVMELPKNTYVYNIVDIAGNIAIQGTAEQTIFSTLEKSSIPAGIFSPFLNDEDVTFYSTYSAGTCSDVMDETPVTNNSNIYVKYTVNYLEDKSIKLDDSQQFNVKLNSEYIYYDASSSHTILSDVTLPTEESDLNYYLWRLEGSDPYAMKIYNVGEAKYVKVNGGTWDDGTALDVDATISTASRFIAMLGNYSGIYEVLAATGNTDYFHIGRPSHSGAETKVYSTATYQHGADQLRFELAGKDPIVYTLIDKAGNELFSVSSNNPRLTIPADYFSPLVETYYYYPTKAKALVDNHTNNITEITDDTNESDEGGDKKDSHVYVTYTVNHLVKFNDNASPYLLKFLDIAHIPEYYLEDGNDKLTTSQIQPIYPYTNGDGSLNIYGQAMNEEQMNGGANTRPRWVWFFESDNSDPYHVKIHSKSTISYNGVSHPTYLQTYAVHFNQDVDPNAKHVVTGGILPGIASVEPTEYMILGLEGEYKLVTTNEIEGERRTVNSLEQYWKTYNMLKLHVLGIPKSTNAFSNDESTWVVPTTDDPNTTADESTYRSTIVARGWHSYDAIANAVRWNGYNDKADGQEKKVVEKLEHWFQTFDMGDGTFDIENANIPPVLILLDRHGWEIMRKPLPTTTYPNGDELDALKAYNSPMVKEYKFYSNATKATGCHKYTLRMQNGAERDQIKYNGKQWTSSSLATLPPISASGVKDNTGVLQDQYVTYTVKEEYENSYQYHLELHEEDQTFVESGTPSKFLVLQNQRFARDNGGAESYLSKPIFEGTNPYDPYANAYDMILSPSQTTVADRSTNVDSNKDGIIDDINLWYVQPNLNIDVEMGIKWAGVAGGSAEPYTEYETKKAYKDKTGFDPYNIQLQNVGNSNYLTTHMTKTSLDKGIMEGDYTDGSKNVTLAAWVDVRGRNTYTPNGNQGYDHTYIQLTNQTFMAVSDDNGNMQLMPRFDHTQRMNVVNSGASSLTTLEDPEDHAKASVEVNSSMGPQTVFMIRPQVFEYHIIDHEGREALRYKTTGEYSPAIKDHFRSPFATDFKFYFDHAAYSTTASSKESYTAAATSDYFKVEAASEEAMETAAKLLTVLDDYYFKIGAAAPYTYKKVTVTKGYVAGSPATDASYTTTDCTEAEWTNAVAYQRTADNEAAMQTAVLSLAAKGFYYYQLGTYKYYKKVTVSGETRTIDDSDKSEYDDAAGSSQKSATDASDFSTKVESLGDGTYYYEIGPLHSYQKVVVTSVNGSSSLTEDVAAHKDISDREITGSFADADLNDLKNQVYVRYSYDEGNDANKILQGKWFTMKLADKEAGVVADGTLDASDGTGVSLLQGTTKPDPVNDDDKEWQWKFLAAPTDAGNVDPYSVRIYNRDKNYDAAKRNVGIKVNGFDRFAILNHSSSEDYAFAVSGAGLSDPNYNYTYTFLNGAAMDTDDPATTVEETNQFTVEDDAAYEAARNALTANGVYYFKLTSHDESNYASYSTYMKVTVTSGPSRAEVESTETDWSNALAYYNNSNKYHFTIKSNALSDDSKVLLIDDVDHIYNYNVINNDASGNKLAVTGTQTKLDAEKHDYVPYLPKSAQTHLLNDDDYLYYATATESSGAYTVDATELKTLCGLYDDVVYVRYNAYDMDKTPYEVPNMRNALNTGTISVASGSKTASLNINGGLPYNIIWEGDKMMSTTSGPVISDGGSEDLNGDTENVWLFDGSDPYALKIKHKSSGKYVNNSSDATCTLEDSATPFMLLKRDGYEYGVLTVTGNQDKLLSGFGSALVTDDHNPETTSDNPKYFIVFALSTHRLIYHLVINESNKTTTIPYRTGTEDAPGALTTKDITGTSQRDLTSSVFGVPGDRYQLGTTIFGRTYSFDAGEVSIGDVLDVPDVFERPNCVYFYYVDNIQQGGSAGTYKRTATDDADLKDKADALAAVGDYYYQLAGQYIYRKVQVTEANDGENDAAYEISGSTADAYSAAEAKAEVATEEAMIANANSQMVIGDYYYKVGPIDIYKRVHVTAVSPITYSISDCTLDDWTNVWQDNSTLNDKYKGLEITKLMSDAGLIGGLVQVNIAYAFQTGLETNAGEGFVMNISDNLWYTFETQDGSKPYLAHYTNAWGLQAMQGRDTRYTNDYLWSPLGDVYGFRMYNRYMIKNSGGTENVMTMPTMTEGTNLKMALPGQGGIPEGFEVFELLGSNTPGYFRIHPVVNNTGTQYYIRKDPSDNYAKISQNYSEWTFGLTSELLKPYVDRVGYVGGLTETAYTANKAALDRIASGSANYSDLRTVQGIVYNDANIVKYTPGYYRLHSQPGVSGIDPVRYASGYLHDIEKTAVSGGIPMHFYSKKGVSTTFGTSGLKFGYTSTSATRGDIPVPATEYDPSTIFFFEGDEKEWPTNPTSTMQTQGLYVVANPMEDTSEKGSGTNRLQRAAMSDDFEKAEPFTLMDIGGAVLLIHDGELPAVRKYLTFDQSNNFQRTAEDDTDMDNQAKKLTSIGTYYFKIGTSTYTYKKIEVTIPYKADPETNATYGAAAESDETDWNKAADIYDLKYYHDSPTDDAKWCMQPANNQGLMIVTNNGGDDYYYTTFCAPFDVLLPDDAEGKTYYAYTCSNWYDTGVHPSKVPAFSTYVAGKFVPAGTPVIIRTNSDSGNIKLTLPRNTPITESSISCIFTGKYLEQMLTGSGIVYAMGLPFTTPVTMDGDGNITAELPEQAKSGVGFYINATPYKEHSELQSMWLRHNRYVLHNKIYYRAGSSSGASAPESTRPQFVPVIFDDDEGGEEEPGNQEENENTRRRGDGCVYDILGRKVASEAEVKSGTWYHHLSPGIYIVNGQKVFVGVGWM